MTAKKGMIMMMMMMGTLPVALLVLVRVAMTVMVLMIGSIKKISLAIKIESALMIKRVK